MTTSMRMIKAMDSKRSVFTVSLSVPKIIGKGPIITAPPPLTFLSLFMAVKMKRMAAIKVMMKPAKTKIVPILNNN